MASVSQQDAWKVSWVVMQDDLSQRAEIAATNQP